MFTVRGQGEQVGRALRRLVSSGGSLEAGTGEHCLLPPYSSHPFPFSLWSSLDERFSQPSRLIPASIHSPFIYGFLCQGFSFFRSLHDWFLHVIHDSTQLALREPLYLHHFLGHYNLCCFLLNYAHKLPYVFIFLKPIYCLSPLCSHLSTSVWFMQYSKSEYLT